MKKIFTTAMVVALAWGMSGVKAETISVEQARQVAKNFVTPTVGTRAVVGEPVLVKTAVAGAAKKAAYYVFNSADNSGFVIVSADDKVLPVLGYSDNGGFDAENVPTNFAWWLSQYEEQIGAYYDGKIDVRPAADVYEHDPIAPMVTSKWNQNNPFNADCPYYDSKNLAATGCVATSMAQMINFYKYPQGNLEGSHTNFYDNTLTFDYSNYKIDWANMLDEYKSGSYTREQSQAVSQLMKACGIAVDMRYGDTSYAYSLQVPYALIHYFGYSHSITYRERAYYDDEEWDDMLYEELSAGRPVIYSGSTLSNSGHSFICDGYQGEGFYHFNWGWGGTSDGYFTTLALYPQGNGQPGSENYEQGYNQSQAMVIGIRPAEEDDEDFALLIAQYGGIQYTGINTSGSSPWMRYDFDLSHNADLNQTKHYVRAIWPERRYIRMASWLIREDGTFGKWENFLSGTSWNFEYGYTPAGTSASASLSYKVGRTLYLGLRNDLEDGTYYFYPAYISANTSQEITDDGSHVKFPFHVVRFMKGYRDHYVMIKSGSEQTDVKWVEPEEGQRVYWARELSVSHDEITIKPGDEQPVYATVGPENATSKSVNWSSSDVKVAQVDAFGYIKGIADGTCYVTATAAIPNRADGIKLSKTIKVTIDTNSGVDEVVGNVMNVTTKGGILYVDGVENGDVINVYNVAGICVASKVATGENVVINLEGQHGVFIVSAGKDKAKVRV